MSEKFSIESMDECEVVLKIKISDREKREKLFKATSLLREAGVTFDTGGCVNEEDVLEYDWELDWSLKGANVFFKRPVVQE